MKNPRGAQNAGSSIGIKRCQAMSARIYGSQQQSEHLIGHVPDDHRHHDYDDDHFGCEVLSGKSKAGWMAWLQCGFPRKANLMTPIKCAHRQLIVVDATTDMRF